MDALMAMKHEITRGDLMPIPEYARVRKDRRQALVAAKRNRRLHVGPYATFHFENYDSMWHQVHEMLYIEKGGEAQIEDELRAYNPLIPNGRELIATVMFEIDDEKQRRNFLAKLGGVEVTLGVNHPAYGHIAILPEATRASLAQDFD